MAAMLADAFGHFNTYQHVVATFRDKKRKERCRRPVSQRVSGRLLPCRPVSSPLLASYTAIDPAHDDVCSIPGGPAGGVMALERAACEVLVSCFVPYSGFPAVPFTVTVTGNTVKPSEAFAN